MPTTTAPAPDADTDVDTDAAAVAITGRTFTFTTTVQAALDAQSLQRARTTRLHLIFDSAALFVGGALAVAGQPIGVLIAVVAAALLTASQLQLVRRWMMARSATGLLGEPTAVSVDGTGARFASALGSMDVPWSVLTAVRSDARTVILLRGGVLAGYLPATSFRGPEEQAAFVRFAAARIEAAAEEHPA